MFIEECNLALCISEFHHDESNLDAVSQIVFACFRLNIIQALAPTPLHEDTTSAAYLSPFSPRSAEPTHPIFARTDGNFQLCH